MTTTLNDSSLETEDAGETSKLLAFLSLILNLEKPHNNDLFEQVWSVRLASAVFIKLNHWKGISK